MLEKLPIVLPGVQVSPLASREKRKEGSGFFQKPKLQLFHRLGLGVGLLRPSKENVCEGDMKSPQLDRKDAFRTGLRDAVVWLQLHCSLCTSQILCQAHDRPRVSCFQASVYGAS